MTKKIKNITIGITGSIAAYKITELIRLLVKNSYNVRVVMTESAKQFITELTLSVLSRNKVYSNYFESNLWHNHSKIADETDLFVIAPATANTIAKLATGINDNLINTIYLSTKAPTIIAPAMDAGMWDHPITSKNINILKSLGSIILNPCYGDLASGFVDKGRMQEPIDIYNTIARLSLKNGILKNIKVLITAGPTIEKIDPVRYISNYSSGRTGYALAEAFAQSGANVVLISGKTDLEIKSGYIDKIKLYKVESANEMYNKAMETYSEAKIIIAAAAVADYKPLNYSNEKIKKIKDQIDIKLEKNIDILKEIGKVKNDKQILIGFALETSNDINNATYKIKTKNLDAIVFNSLSNGECFISKENKISIINKSGSVSNYDRKGKDLIAKDIIQYIIANFKIN